MAPTPNLSSDSNRRLLRSLPQKLILVGLPLKTLASPVSQDCCIAQTIGLVPGRRQCCSPIRGVTCRSSFNYVDTGFRQLPGGPRSLEPHLQVGGGQEPGLARLHSCRSLHAVGHRRSWGTREGRYTTDGRGRLTSSATLSKFIWSNAGFGSLHDHPDLEKEHWRFQVRPGPLLMPCGFSAAF